MIFLTKRKNTSASRAAYILVHFFVELCKMPMITTKCKLKNENLLFSVYLSQSVWANLVQLEDISFTLGGVTHTMANAISHCKLSRSASHLGFRIPWKISGHSLQRYLYRCNKKMSRNSLAGNLIRIVIGSCTSCIKTPFQLTTWNVMSASSDFFDVSVEIYHGNFTLGNVGHTH